MPRKDGNRYYSKARSLSSSKKYHKDTSIKKLEKELIGKATKKSRK